MTAPLRFTFAPLMAALIAFPSIKSFGLDEPARAASAATTDPAFEALFTDGKTAIGRIVRLSAAEGLVLEEPSKPAVATPWSRVVKLSRESSPPAPGGDWSTVLLPDGDRLPRCVLTASDGAKLEVRSDSLGALSIPIDGIIGIIFKPQPCADAAFRFASRLRSEPRTSEVVWLANGDRLAGGLEEFSDKKVVIKRTAGKTELDRADVLALGFDPALVNYPAPTGVHLEIGLVDGTRLGLSEAKMDGARLVGKTRFGQPVRIPLAEISRIRMRNAGVTYLSDGEPAAVQYVPYIGPVSPIRRDASVLGLPFLLNGKAYDRGLGAQSRTLIAYRLDPLDRRFQALVGVDDRAGSLSSVVFRVLVDGKERFASPPMSARDQARLIDADVSGGRLLILATEFGERGDVQDYANWVEARLVR